MWCCADGCRRRGAQNDLESLPSIQTTSTYQRKLVRSHGSALALPGQPCLGSPQLKIMPLPFSATIISCTDRPAGERMPSTISAAEQSSKPPSLWNLGSALHARSDAVPLVLLYRARPSHAIIGKLLVPQAATAPWASLMQHFQPIQVRFQRTQARHNQPHSSRTPLQRHLQPTTGLFTTGRKAAVLNSPRK